MQINITHSSLMLFSLVVFGLSALVQFIYYALVYAKMAFYKAPVLPRTVTQPGVSIIIAARNESENLRANLPIILNQKYPEFEVIVVNDGSYDDSLSVLHSLKKEYSGLKILNRHEDGRYDHGKKLALTIGIKAASFDRLLFTDADCRPTSSRWITEMVTSCRYENDIVLGYSPFIKEKGLLNALIRFEGFFTALNYLGFARAGSPYMGVGRNLSYPKSAFFKVGGFKKHNHIQSGDDDLFINEIATAQNTRICLSANALVETRAKKTWKEFWRQRRRHLSTGGHYKNKHKFLLALQPLSFLLMAVSATVLIVFNSALYIVLGVLAIRILIQFFIFSHSTRVLGQRDLIIVMPVLEIISVAMSGLAHLANLLAKQTEWKN